MKWLLLLALILGCAGKQLNDELVDKMSLVVDNNNWYQATVYLVSDYGSLTSKRLVGRVRGLGEERFELRSPYPGGFRVYVKFFANGDVPWLDDIVWYKDWECVKVWLGRLSQFSYSTPC